MKAVSRSTLQRLMRREGKSIRQLATDARCSRATVGHLVSGNQLTTSDDIAAAIEQALNVQVGTVFRVPEVSRDEDAVTRRNRSAWLTLDDLATRVHLPADEATELALQGELHGHFRAGRWFFDRKSVNAWVREQDQVEACGCGRTLAVSA